MFTEKLITNILTYPTHAKGWENGVYQERRTHFEESSQNDTDFSDYCILCKEYVSLPNRMWTETEDTGFGIYPYVESLVFQKQTGLTDGKWTAVFTNPTDADYQVSAFANGILKIDGQTVPAHNDLTVSFSLCSVEEITSLQFFVPTKCIKKEDADLQTVYLKDIKYEVLPQKAPHGTPVLFIASDSTVQSYEPFYYPQTGWGQVLNHFLVPDEHWTEALPEDALYPQCRVYTSSRLIIENRSIGARSSRSFLAEGKWDALLHRAAPGDFCLLQWAHNDATAVRPNRYVAASDFAWYLKKYIASCKSRGIHLILVTPVSRRNCDDHNGDFALSFGEYRDVMLALGREEQIPVIDLCATSNAYLKELGPEESKQLYLWCPKGAYPDGAYADGVSDNTHLQEYGALIYAQMVAQGILDSSSPELECLKPLIHTNVTIPKPVPAAVSAETDPLVPSGFALQELHVENNLANFLLIWNTIPDAVSYNVYRKGTADFQFFPLRSVTKEEKETAAVLPFQLPAADVYQVYVTAVFADKQESAPSRKIEFRA